MTDREKAIREIVKAAHQPHSFQEVHIVPSDISMKCGVPLRYVHEVFFVAADEGLIELKTWDKTAGEALPYTAYPSVDDFFYRPGDRYVRVTLLLKGLELLQLDTREPIGFV